MLHRTVALVGLFALSPAHATLIEHPSTSSIANLSGDVHEDFGVGVDDTIAREFLFGAWAPRSHYPHLWRLQMRGDDRQAKQANRHFIEWAEFSLGERFIGPLTNAGLQVPDAYEWRYGTLNRWLRISFADASSHGTRAPESVPEPTTLSLLAAGILGAWAARRRRRVADA